MNLILLLILFTQMFFIEAVDALMRHTSLYVERHAVFVNRKGWHSINVQLAIYDHEVIDSLFYVHFHSFLITHQNKYYANQIIQR